MKLKNYLFEIKYFFKKFEFLKVYNSPFKTIIPKLYIGKVAVGTPYFFPRNWVKATPKLAKKAALEALQKERDFNIRNPKNIQRVRTYSEIYRDNLNYLYPVSKKIGFDFVGLGWKTKWEYNDYRFEWNPVWSFVFFKWQIALIFAPKEDENHYWECWLAYSRDTDKTKSTKERIEQAKKDFPCIWSSYKDGVKTTICYWDKVLKKKWL